MGESVLTLAELMEEYCPHAYCCEELLQFIVQMASDY